MLHPILIPPPQVLLVTFTFLWLQVKRPQREVFFDFELRRIRLRTLLLICDKLYIYVNCI